MSKAINPFKLPPVEPYTIISANCLRNCCSRPHPFHKTAQIPCKRTLTSLLIYVSPFHFILVEASKHVHSTFSWGKTRLSFLFLERKWMVRVVCRLMNVTRNSTGWRTALHFEVRLGGMWQWIGLLPRGWNGVFISVVQHFFFYDIKCKMIRSSLL